MKNSILAALAPAFALVLALPAFAATKTYQVTGPVLDTDETTITVENKAKEKWMIEKSASTKGAADVKKGDKVTIYYKMVADEVESKGGAKSEAKADAKADKKKK